MGTREKKDRRARNADARKAFKLQAEAKTKARAEIGAKTALAKQKTDKVIREAITGKGEAPKAPPQKAGIVDKARLVAGSAAKSPKARTALQVGRNVAKAGGLAATALTLAAIANKDKAEAHNKRMMEERIKQAKGETEAPRKDTVLREKPKVQANKPKAEASETESFKEAFRRNRKAGASTFKWKGKTYTTKTKEEQGPVKNGEFGKAFKAAKAAGKDVFTFNGKRYSTKSK